MPLKLYRRNQIWHYRGAVDGDYLRGSTGTADRKEATRIAAEITTNRFKGGYAAAGLTFPQAVAHYLKAGKSDQYLDKLEDYWKNTKVRKMTVGAIRQSAVDLYPGRSGATWNRQVITPTRAIINHCAELELCAPIRIKGYKFQAEKKEPVTLDWITTLAIHARPIIKALAYQMFATAERFCEAHSTVWNDYNFEQRTVRVCDTKTKEENFAHMPQPLLIALANLPRDKRPFYYSETTLRRFWDEDVARAAKAVPGFKRLTFHCCRHGFATKMLRDGVDPKTAAALGRWKDTALFLNTYAHALENRQLTEGLFSTKTAQSDDAPEQKQGVVIK